MIEVGRAVGALQQILDGSSYFPYLIRNVRHVGFKIGGHALLMDIDFGSGRVKISRHEAAGSQEPEVWVTVEERSLLEADVKAPRLSVRQLWTPQRAEPHPALEQILARCFDVGLHGPARSDREDLVFGALFGFTTPEVLWQHSTSGVRVLLYRAGIEGLDACVTSGFTDPEIGTTEFPEPLLGFGYELVMLCQRDEPVLWKEFQGWARYVLETGNHVLRGNWLEYQEGRIPGTDLGGFLVVAPATFPARFPLAGGYGQFNLLLGATPTELEAAKRSSVVPVAQQLFEKGYQDWSTSRRDSVPV